MNEHMFIHIKSFHVQIHNFRFLGTKIFFFFQMLTLKDFYAATLINNIEVVAKKKRKFNNFYR